MAAATYLDWRERARCSRRSGIYRYRGYTLTGDGEAERLITVDVSPVLFRCSACPPLLGRTFTDDEERPGNESRKVVLSHGAWVRRFGQDPNVIWQDDDAGRRDAQDRRRDAARLSVSRRTIPTSSCGRR